LKTGDPSDFKPLQGLGLSEAIPDIVRKLANGSLVSETNSTAELFGSSAYEPCIIEVNDVFKRQDYNWSGECPVDPDFQNISSIRECELIVIHEYDSRDSIYTTVGASLCFVAYLQLIVILLGTTIYGFCSSDKGGATQRTVASRKSMEEEA